MRSKLLKKLGIGVCVLSMVLSSSVLSNVYTDPMNQGIPIYITDANETITPYQDVITGKDVSTNNSTWTSTTFTIPSKASYFNVDFKNNTDGAVAIKIMNSSGVYDSFEVEANDQEYLQINDNGKYYVQIDKQGGNIQGTLRVAYYE